MDVVLWAAQILLVVAFGFSAAVKGTQTKERAIELGMSGVVDIDVSTMRFIAAAEVLAILGLIVPYVSGIAPILTPAAALGLAVIMLLAARIHLRLEEPRTALGNLALLVLCLLVAVGRWPT